MAAMIRVDYRDSLARLAGANAALGDAAPLSAALGEALVRQMQRCIDDGRGPDGVPWAPIKRNGQALRLTGELYNSLHYEVLPGAVEAGSSLGKALFHQEGTAPRTIRPRRKQALFWPGAAHPVASVEHPGLPARPFVPRSEDELDQAELLATVLDYLQEALLR